MSRALVGTCLLDPLPAFPRPVMRPTRIAPLLPIHTGLCLAVALTGCVAETGSSETGAGGEVSGGGSSVGGAAGSTPTGGTAGTGGMGASGGSGGTGGAGGECPDGVICVSTFPYSHTSTTSGAASDQLDGYSCAPGTNESGPEVIYRVQLPAEGFLALELPEAEMAPAADIDVHLLQDLDASTCLERGHWRAGALLPAGTYWVTADTYVSAGGEEYDGGYTLTFGLTTVADLATMGMASSVAYDALWAFDAAWTNPPAGSLPIHFGYAVTDFSLPSDQRRLWVLDLTDGSLRHHLYVPHGDASSDPNDSRWAVDFSNVPESHKSSLGVMQGAETYTGTYGYSMRIDGLEPGYNDNVRARAMVVHPWNGSTPSYVSTYGECAPTWGCSGIDPAFSTDVADYLANGGLLLYHYPDGDWSVSSAYLP